MIKLVEKNNVPYLKHKIANILMQSGKKNTGEKIVLKLLKSLQKSLDVKSVAILHAAIINSTSTFKINEQSVKKGKRKAVKIVPSFIMCDSLRITNALKLIKKISRKNKNPSFFYQNFSAEFVSTANSKSQIIEQKNEIQKQILLNRRYLTKFRW